MKEAFQAAEGRELYTHGKALEDQFHRPVREAERAARQAEHRSPERTGPTY